MTIVASFARVYVSDIDEGIALFQRTSDERPRLRFSHSSGLEVALVGDVLILAGPDDVLSGFRNTQVTLLVDDLDHALADADARRGTLVQRPAEQPTGRNATVGYPNGAVVEYVEWSPGIRAEVGL